MAQHKVIDLINQFMEDHGQSSGKDRVMLWLEDVYSKVRRLPWSWNFKVTQTQTGGDLVTNVVITSNPDFETFSWNQGEDYITASNATVTTADWQSTGRYLYIGDEWYRCTHIAPAANTDRIYLDKKIVTAAATGQTISLYRRDLAFQTNGIKSLRVDDYKIEHLTDEQIYRFKRGLDPRWYYGDSGRPLAYHLDDYDIAFPIYKPSVVMTADASATTTAGAHRAFFTFYDSETGQESAPGPSVEFTITSALPRAKISYSSPLGSHSVETTYRRRLYVTRVVDQYTRNPAYDQGSATHDFIGSQLFNISDELLESGNPGYYDGSWERTVLYPAPDEYLRVECLHIDTWFGLPDEKLIIKLGRQREFIELFHLYFLMKQSIQNKDPKQFRMMQGSFREQMNFLLAQDGDDRRLDPSSWEYKFYSPMTVAHDDFTSSLKYPF
jgi:hypothetical protein